MKQINKKNGFTVAEVMVAVSLLLIVVVVLSNLLFAVFKNAAKAEIAKNIRQNGNYALSIMEDRVINTTRIVNCSSSDLQLVMLSGEEVRYRVLDQALIEEIKPVGAAAYDSPIYLTDKTVKINGLTIMCYRKKYITLTFTLEQSLGSTGRTEDQVSMIFKTNLGTRAE